MINMINKIDEIRFSIRLRFKWVLIAINIPSAIFGWKYIVPNWFIKLEML